jgi:hydrogenase maturation protein HypF
VQRIRTKPVRTFAIISSRGRPGHGIDVTPDLAVCPECRAEVADIGNRRYRYPFTNCTQCGPRYTIIETLPYDRPRTTMRDFDMCPACETEYRAPADRRHHAQPNACPNCGPRLQLLNAAGVPTTGDPLTRAARLLARGRILAIKSLGGFQLACDATNDQAVARLRRLKHRPAKPLALMCATAVVARRFCRVDAAAARLLASAAAPVVLLPKTAGAALSPRLAPRNSRFGVMLPYTPLHRLIFSAGAPQTLVMTSGNRHDEPLARDEKELRRSLRSSPFLTLTHNRSIANRCDDSVVLAADPPVMVRRARGYAPAPVNLNAMFHVKHSVLAVGSETKNAFALASGSKAYLSPHVGDLGSQAGERFWRETLARYQEWTGIRPEVVACDFHPDYATTRLAESIASGLGHSPVRVQHHVAHALSVVAEHAVTERCLAVVCDGVGYGTDGAVWGCEFLLLDGAAWSRVGHMKYLRLVDAGLELADPSRTAAAYLSQIGESRAAAKLGLPIVGGNCRGALRTSSLGRLFDAVAAISGACRKATFEGEGPVALESVAERQTGGYRLTNVATESDGGLLLDPAPLLAAVLADRLRGEPPGVIAGRFHVELLSAIATIARQLARCGGVQTVCLSGGSFQNTLLRRGLTHILDGSGFRVLVNQAVPVNDGGLALGQVLAAAAAVRLGPNRKRTRRPMPALTAGPDRL